jgi:hypothetical protein
MQSSNQLFRTYAFSMNPVMVPLLSDDDESLDENATQQPVDTHKINYSMCVDTDDEKTC